jgi:hypothetical protein
MRPILSGPAKLRSRWLLLFIFLLPFLLHAVALLFPASEVFDYYDRLAEDEEMQQKTQSRRR